MSKLLKFLFPALIAGLLIFSCSEDSTGPGDDGDGDGNPQASQGQIAMSIFGNNWQSFSAAADTNMTGGDVTTVGFGGVAGSPTFASFGLAFADLSGIKEQTYTFGPGTNVGLSAVYSNPADTTQLAVFDPQQSSGTVTITELDYANRTISGSFSLDLHRDFGGALVEVRNGSFNKVVILD